MKAVVLCAGYGTRLGDLTQSLPKPLLPVDGDPLLAHNLRYLKGQGIQDIAINLHYLPEQIPTIFGDGRRFGVRIHYSYEGDLLGTAGALLSLESWLADAEDFLVLYGDILTNQSITALMSLHRREAAFATLLLHQRKRSNSMVTLDENGRIRKFVERPTDEQRRHLLNGGDSDESTWVNSGLQVLNRRVLDCIPRQRASDLPRDVYSVWVEREPIFGVPLIGYRVAIDSAERYAEAEQLVRIGK